MNLQDKGHILVVEASTAICCRKCRASHRALVCILTRMQGATASASGANLFSEFGLKHREVICRTIRIGSHLMDPVIIIFAKSGDADHADDPSASRAVVVEV